jgi:phytoene dehydrogenase-like protein
MKITNIVVAIIFVTGLTNTQGFTIPHHNTYTTSTGTGTSSTSSSSSSLFSSNNKHEIVETDVVVIGSGFGGLSCAALTSKYNLDTICVEAHDTPGGVAHSFSRYNNKATTAAATAAVAAEKKKVPFRFDSGPSLISGLSSKSTNPLRQVLDAINVQDEIEWLTYDGWVVHDYADNKKFKLTTGDGSEFPMAIEEKAGIESRKEFERLSKEMLQPNGLTEVSGYIPPFALRGDTSVIVSLFQYLWKFLQIGTKGTLLTGPFTKTLDLYNVKDDFLLKWFDYLAFALSGLDAAHTQAAPVSYTMGDLHRPGCVLDYPKGGMDSLIDALVKGMTDHGGELQLNSRVDKFLLVEKNGKAHCEGVVLNSGKIIKARKGVVCSAPLWNMAKMLEDSTSASIPTDGTTETSCIDQAVAKVREQANEMEMTGSFMHLHLGIPKDGIDEKDLELHYSVLNFDLDVTAEQNLVIISIPTVVDPSLAPEGYHIIHAYTAASENFSDWDPFLDGKKDSGKVGSSPNSKKASSYNQVEGYDKLKDEKAEALWKAIETIIPDVRERADTEGAIKIVGTPLTHRRYNQRYRGTYGPAPPDGKDVWELPGPTTPINGLLACGDTTFPGIGLPGVAASGTIAANTLVDVGTQLSLMKELKSKGALQ